jgi:lipoprotein-anchoring transpeptidase ErfK/SrfK
MNRSGRSIRCFAPLAALAMLLGGIAWGQRPEAITEVVPVSSATPAPPVSMPNNPAPVTVATTPLPPVGEAPPDVAPSSTPAPSAAAPVIPETTPAITTPAPTVTPAAPIITSTESAVTPAAPAVTGTESADVPYIPPQPHFSIEIDLTHQRVYLLEDGHGFAESPISSGRADHLTPTGNFEVLQKDLDHFSNLYGKIVEKDSGRLVKAGADAAMPVPKGCVFVPAPMKWFMRFDGASGMHAGILPGYAASHGCVRMPADKAELFYETIDVGTPVHVFGTAPIREMEEKTGPHRLAQTMPKPTPTPKAHHGWWF